MTSNKIGKYLIRGREIDLSRPCVMGILNCTPDSFSDGGDYFQTGAALTRIAEMAAEGAKIIDIGGESTRPGSEPVSEKDELNRVMPVISQAVTQFPDLFFSIDTTKFEVARQALDAGAHIINDVSGLRKEPRLADLCSETGAGIVIMHSIGDPKTMQKNPSYNDVVTEVREFLSEKAAMCSGKGIGCVILDPGFGFGKNLEHNLSLLKNLAAISGSGYPVLAGISRKSMLGQILDGRNAEGRLAATISAHFYALQQGTRILRVHDVCEAADSIRIFESLWPGFG